MARNCRNLRARLALSRRLIQLYAGLLLYGLSMALMIRSDMGLNPWDVLHQGVALQTGLTFGTVVILAGAVVLMLWIPLRERPGLGTISNILVIGVAADLSLSLIPEVDGMVSELALLGSGILFCGIAGGAYIGARFGPGPRDGLMTGIARKTGWPLRRVRTAIELAALAVGMMLDGIIGIGTILFAVCIGPLVQWSLRIFASPPSAPFSG